ncbi:MAG TPA: HEAT repeat domain-containing protein, partial [Pyrinomonadaceae bacterium]
DEQIEKYFNEGGNPRHVQHALSQIGEGLEAGKPGVGRWFPRVVEASGSQSADVRMTAAWVMGLEHRRDDFHEALLRLLADPEPIVRRNAALALVRFGDPSCRPELLAMLLPHTVTARTEGIALTALTAGTPVRRDTLLLRYKSKPNLDDEVRSPLPGKISQAMVKEGDNFRAGDVLFVIAPDGEHVRDALIGLQFFGEAEDLPEMERFAVGVEGMSEEVKKQAAATAEAVRRRSSGRS